jgi:GMP synthase (glutamine-hydrolysing)
MAKQIILVRHDAEAVDDRVARYLTRQGYEPRLVRPCLGEPLPSEDDPIEGCVIFGGLYNAFDVEKHPFLAEEYALIERCLRQRLPLLGICQGAQMIAWHLGADVGPLQSGVHEFGYYELRPTAEAGDFLQAPLFVTQSHWHGFDLPTGAVRLASSEHFPNQAFRLGENVYGFQFHAEIPPAQFRLMQERGGSRYGLPGVQPREEQDRLMALHDPAQAAWFDSFLARLFPAS